MGLPPDWCATYIILLDQCYTILERRGASLYTIRKHLLHMDHPLDLRGRGIGRVDLRGRGRDGRRGRGRDGEGGCGTPKPTLPTSIPPILTHHLILPYFPRLTHHSILLYPHQLIHHIPYPHTLTHLYHLR